MVLDYNEMIPFIISSIKKKSLISFLFISMNVLLFLLILIFIISRTISGQLTLSVILKQVIFGLLSGSIFIIPVHELLHGLAYKILGARKIQFGADFKQFIFYVTANRYPVSGKEFIFLALTPFVLINIVTIVSAVYWIPGGLLYAGALLLTHNIMCIGDFAMVSYVFRNRIKRLFTFDEVEEKKSYFFEKILNNQK